MKLWLCPFFIVVAYIPPGVLARLLDEEEGPGPVLLDVWFEFEVVVLAGLLPDCVV